LDLLFDESFYNELFQFATHNSTTLGMQNKNVPCDGVVTALGQINSKLAASQDFTVMGGSVGNMHAMGPNVVGTAIAAGLLLFVFGK
jgi:propionyl-CoA carboxylase beta chain